MQPTKTFQFLLDPANNVASNWNAFFGVFDLIKHLNSKDIGVSIEIVIPMYLATEEDQGYINHYEASAGITFKRIESGTKVPEIDLKNLLEKHEEGKEKYKKHLAILSLASHLKVDGIITRDKPLSRIQYDLYHRHRIRICSPATFENCLDVIAHGNYVYRSVDSTVVKLSADAFYQQAHWKAVRYHRWFMSYGLKIPNDALKEDFRSLFLHRYPYILHARDMVLFYEIQKAHYLRRGIEYTFNLLMGFYLNTYYLLLWGMLDHIAVILNKLLNLGINDRQCGIRNPKFLKELHQAEPALWTFLLSDRVQNWIALTASFRNRAAHQQITLPSQFIEDNEIMRLSDTEVIEKIREEGGSTYKKFSEIDNRDTLPIVKKLARQNMIDKWRLSKATIISDGSVVLQDKDDKPVLYDPVGALDQNLEYLEAIVDACMVKCATEKRCFGKRQK